VIWREVHVIWVALSALPPQKIGERKIIILIRDVPPSIVEQNAFRKRTKISYSQMADREKGARSETTTKYA